MKMRFLTPLIIALALYGCSEAEGETTVDDLTTEKETATEDFLTEVITRTYSVKMVENEPTIDTLQQMQSVTSDSDGKEIESTFYNLDNTIGWIDRYTYDDAGNKTGSDYLAEGTENTIYYSYDLDDKGRKTFYQAFDRGTDALLFNGATKYSASGTMKKDGYINEKGEFICSFEYQLDQEGGELGYAYIDALTGKRFPSIYKYIDYNDDNEWVKRLVVSNDVVKSIETREFVKKEIE